MRETALASDVTLKNAWVWCKTEVACFVYKLGLTTPFLILEVPRCSPPAAPESSARVAVPLPKALVQSVDACTQAALAVPEAHRLTAPRLLLCAQWSAHDKRVLDLSDHESAALTCCGSPAVSTPKNAALNELPAKHNRKHQTLDLICIHACWIKVCGRCAE